MALLILAVLIVQAGFPVSPGQISLLTVGIPTFGIALWTRPGPPPRNLPRRLLQFVLPAASLLAVAAFAVYLGVYVLYDIDLPAMRGGVTAATSLPASDLVSREAAMHVLVLGGLVLVLFAAPPGPWFAVVEELDGERRPAYLALAMAPLYALVMMTPALRGFFGLLNQVDYGIVAIVVLIWMYLLRWVWATRVFDRFFGYDE